MGRRGRPERRRFLVLFFACALAGAVAEVMIAPTSTIPRIGASGAVAGLMGAYLVLFPQVKLYQVVWIIPIRLRVVWSLGFWLAYNALMASGDVGGVAWMAHIGGFFMGVLISLWNRPKTLHALLQPA